MTGTGGGRSRSRCRGSTVSCEATSRISEAVDVERSSGQRSGPAGELRGVHLSARRGLPAHEGAGRRGSGSSWGDTGVRADAEVQWIMPRPRGERIPSGARLLEVTVARPGAGALVKRTVSNPTDPQLTSSKPALTIHRHGSDQPCVFSGRQPAQELLDPMPVGCLMTSRVKRRLRVGARLGV